MACVTVPERIANRKSEVVQSCFSVLTPPEQLATISFSEMLTTIWRSWKSWNREKGLALLAVAALAIGIGSATAIFTVVDAVLLKPLPYLQGDRWVALLAGSTRDPKDLSGLSFADCAAYQEKMHSFEVFGCYNIFGDFNLTSPGQSRHIEGTEVSSRLIANAGIAPTAGRFFTPADGPNVALISHRLLEQLGSNVIGHLIKLNGEGYTVVGVMPAWFRLPIATVADRNSHNDVWIPLKIPGSQAQARNAANYASYARLKPNVSFQQAKAEAIRVADEIRKLNNPDNPTYTAAFFGLQEMVVKTIRPILLLLFTAAGLLLLITCANVAGLLVSRSIGRARETALRIALGSGAGQLAVQYFLESLWISLAAAAAGILLSVVLVRALIALGSDYIPRSHEVGMDLVALLFALGLAFLTATLSALAPLLQAFRTPPAEALGDSVRASAGVRSRRLSRVLVVTEIALAFTLVSAGGVLIWQVRSLYRTSPGLSPDGVLTFQLTRAGAQASNAKQSSVYAQKILDALASIPGVTDVAVTNQLPFEGCCFATSLFFEGRPTAADRHEPLSLMTVSTGYFKALRIPLLAGRLLTAYDTSETLIPVVIDSAAASRYWPGENAIGKLARLNSQQGSQLQVVGIVGTVQNRGLGKIAMPELYLSNAILNFDPVYVVVRSTLTAPGISSAIRRAITHVNPSQPIYAVQAMDEIIETSLTFERIEWIVVTFFALAALLMACLGVYGLMSYSVRQRTTEMGTRLALGSSRGQLLRLIVVDGLRLGTYGIIIGLCMAVVSSQMVSYYFKVNHPGAIPYLLSMAVVLVVAILASLAPALRASLISPMVAIRNDSESVWITLRRSVELARRQILPPRKPPPFDSSMLTEFIESSRKADSFAEMLQAFLLDLSSKINARSAFLLERVGAREFRCIAAVPAGLEIAPIVPDNGFLLNRLRFYGAPMSFTPADVETSQRWAMSNRPHLLSELTQLQTLGLRLAAPLRTKKDVIGLLLFGDRENHDEYTLEEKDLAAACAEQFALTIENARLNERIVEQERVNRDIALATEVQNRLLPESSLQSGGSSFSAFTLAARSVGGDYYDFLRVGERTIGIALADVAGKGIAAALIMAVVQASLRIIAAEDSVTLPQLAAKMNHFLHRSTGFSSYATFFYAQLDEDQRQLRYVNAGHNPPYLVRAAASQEGENKPDALIEELTTGGMIIGMFPAASYEEAVVDLNSGDVLLAFTDGVTEALNPDNEEFGEERLKQLVRKVAHLPTVEMTSSIAQELRTWIAEAPQHDDLTFLVMKMN